MPLKKYLALSISLFFGGVNSKIIIFLKLSQKLKVESNIKRFFHNRMQHYGVYISPNAVIGEGMSMPHPVGIVIGNGVIIGDGLTIFQNVTIGGARIGDSAKNFYPKIGNNVVIFAGAVIVGKVEIGDGAIIGANAVVLKSVPSGSVCVGVPGQIVRSRIKGDFLEQSFDN